MKLHGQALKAQGEALFKRPPLALMLVLITAGFLLVITGTATSQANQTQEPRRQALVNQILSQRDHVDDLDSEVASARSEVAIANEALGRASAKQNDRLAGDRELANYAGTTALKGDGVVVKLSDAASKSGQESATFDASRIQDDDVQLVVNALFASGAEAIAINDNRISVVSPIRAAGGTIVVNYRPVSAPYRIVAIGADEKKFSSSEIANHFRQWKKKFNLGYTVEKHKKLTVPPYTGRVAIDVAQPSVEPEPTTSTTVASTGSSTRPSTTSPSLKRAGD